MIAMMKMISEWAVDVPFVAKMFIAKAHHEARHIYVVGKILEILYFVILPSAVPATLASSRPQSPESLAPTRYCP